MICRLTSRLQWSHWNTTNAKTLFSHTILACIIKPWYIKKKSVVSGVLRIMTAGWPNILWQHIILQLNISVHEYRKIFQGQLNVVCLTMQIKRGVLGDLRDLWCGFSACASFNSRVTSAIPVFITTTPESTETGCSTGFWVVIQFDLHNNSKRYKNSSIMRVAGKWPVSV